VSDLPPEIHTLRFATFFICTFLQLSSLVNMWAFENHASCSSGGSRRMEYTTPMMKMPVKIVRIA
jgi:hypothetical protein